MQRYDFTVRSFCIGINNLKKAAKKLKLTYSDVG